MNFHATGLPGVVLVEPKVFGDARGFFKECYHRDKFAAAGIEFTPVQENHSRSGSRILRGLHFQEPRAQGKLVRAARGAIFDVAVDVRRGSPTFGRWTSVELTEDNHLQLWVPAGFGHGFCVLSDFAEVTYLTTEVYVPETERVIAWNDPDLAIAWPISDPILSARDAAGLRLAELPVLPPYQATP